MKQIFHFSIDCDWIPNSEKALPRLFEIIAQFNIKPTFFLTANFAINNKDFVQEIIAKDFEIGCHGLKHGLDGAENFGSSVSYNNQKRILSESSEIIRKISGVDPFIFRAPKLNISNQTFDILKGLNYKIDSSIPAKRYDFGMGNINDFNSINKKSSPFLINNSILEVPPSAFILPLNMRFLRLFGANFACALFKAICLNTNVIVFYLHPAEFVSPSVIQYVESDKQFYKNCGESHFDILCSFLEKIFTGNLLSEKMAYHINQ